jgi:hypothetical protein
MSNSLYSNYSDPRALVLDWFDPTTPTLYVGPNGGWALLKIDINTLTIVGYPSKSYYCFCFCRLPRLGCVKCFLGQILT